MPTHRWGDEDFDWDSLYAAIKFIGPYLKRRRVPVRDYKEKWGQLRLYCNLGYCQFHDLFFPGYVYNQWPKWLWRLDCHYGSRIIGVVNFFMVPLNRYWYRRAHKLAIKKWPSVRAEILGCPDWPELLKGL